jgi:hypothetical protein
MSSRDIHCGGIMLLRKPETVSDNFHLELLFLEDGKGEFTLPKGEKDSISNANCR